ncbi:MAG: hypothetical protein M3384_18015 [Acidobacteriota bacterium]|nr:hypothetical protein [Acidobacteriota bacterium]
MTKKTKPQNDEAPEEAVEEKPATGDAASWSRDQREKGYYYDDDCGYEVYNPDEDDEED